jgi:hypothetical protein
MEEIIFKIDSLKTEVNNHMDMDSDYKELIANQLSHIKKIVKNLTY